MTSHLSTSASWDADKQRLVLDDQVLFNAGMLRMKPGAGEQFTVRVERPADAYTHGQMKHYFGHLIAPLSEWNGEFPTEWDIRLKAMFLPEGKTSKTQCSKDELAAFIQQCEVYVHTAHPEAFALYDHTRA